METVFTLGFGVSCSHAKYRYLRGDSVEFAVSFTIRFVAAGMTAASLLILSAVTHLFEALDFLWQHRADTVLDIISCILCQVCFKIALNANLLYNAFKGLRPYTEIPNKTSLRS